MAGAQHKKLKKDVVWKLIFRLFRRFYKDRSERKLIKDQINYNKQNNLHDNHNAPMLDLGAVAVSVQFVSDIIDAGSTLKEAHRVFDSMELDPKFKSDRNAMGCLLLVRSSLMTHQKSLTVEYSQIVQSYKGVFENFFKIFCENSVMKRINFFSCPMIQHMWSVFATSEMSLIVETINSYFCDKPSDYKDRFVEDVKQLGNQLQFQILDFLPFS